MYQPFFVSRRQQVAMKYSIPTVIRAVHVNDVHCVILQSCDATTFSGTPLYDSGLSHQ